MVTPTALPEGRTKTARGTPTKTKARHANDTSYNIKTFAIELAISAADRSQDVIRQAETITS